MDAAIEAGVEHTGVEHPGAEEEQLSSVALPCDAAYSEEQCSLKEGRDAQDEGEILLVQELQDFQGVISEAVVVDDVRQQHAGLAGAVAPSRAGNNYQQYQPLLVQGFVTSTGDVVHVVQDTPASGAHGGHRGLNPTASLPGQTYQHPYQHQPQMMHPDLYRLIKMFPDFSPKTLHRIFVMCRCDLKRSLDQALFARQFRQLDSAPSYSPIAPSSSQHAAHATHFPAAPYRAPARSPYMQMGVDLGDMYLPRGRASHGPTAAPVPQTPQASASAPILLYQQAANMQPLGHPLGQHRDADAADVVQIKLDLSADVAVGKGLGDSLAGNLGMLVDAGSESDGATLGPGGDKQGEDSKDMLPDLAEVTVEDSPHVAGTEAIVGC